MKANIVQNVILCNLIFKKMLGLKLKTDPNGKYCRKKHRRDFNRDRPRYRTNHPSTQFKREELVTELFVIAREELEHLQMVQGRSNAKDNELKCERAVIM